MTSFVLKGFPCDDQFERSFIEMVAFYVLTTCNVFNFLINFNFWRHNIAYFVLKVPSQSIN